MVGPRRVRRAVNGKGRDMKRFSRWAVVALAFAAIAAGCAVAARKAPVPTGQSAQALEATEAGKPALKYLLYIPEGYNEAKRPWPLVLFLHGAGERGDDLEKVKIHGPPKLAAAGKQFPFILVSPQCPQDSWWPKEADRLKALLDEIGAKYDVDKDREYVTGLSMGGFGTWALAFAEPHRFAALAPICGRGDPDKVAAIKHVPVWVFHGGKDNVVPLKDSEAMVEALKAAGATPKFTVYPEAGHDSWTATYDNPEFYEWMLAQRRKK